MANWNREGEKVAGEYCGIFFEGTVAHSRVKYGGEVQHCVDLVFPINVFGEPRDALLVNENELILE